MLLCLGRPFPGIVHFHFNLQYKARGAHTQNMLYKQLHPFPLSFQLPSLPLTVTLYPTQNPTSGRQVLRVSRQVIFKVKAVIVKKLFLSQFIQTDIPLLVR